jgi:DNA polymerase-3 subunit alpha
VALKLKSQKYVPLHNHSEYSYLDSVIKVKGLGPILRSKGFSAYAMTEHGNVNGVYEFVKDLNGAGVKSILGCEFYMVPNRHRKGLSEEERALIKAEAKKEGIPARQAIKTFEELNKIRHRNHVVVLAKNNTGWRKIIRAVELSHKEGFYYFPRIDYEILKKLAPDVIVLTACIAGVPSQLILENNYDGAWEWCSEMAEHFGPDFFIEIQPNDIKEQIELNIKLTDVACDLGVGIVATNDIHYLTPDDYVTHDVLLALRESQGGKSVLVTDEDRFRYSTNQLYLKTCNEMELSFEKFHPNLKRNVWKNALDKTLEIAERIDSNVLEFRKGVLPVLKIEKEYEGNYDEKLWDLVRDGWKWRQIDRKCKGKSGVIDWLDGESPKETTLRNVYIERVKFEMGEIIRLGFARYFLVVWDLVKWARGNNIRVGPGRGSVGGSLVAYLLGITSLDSVKYKCPWSRFISPDRIDYPDIDCDFAGKDRDRIKKYLIFKYGKSKVASIITFGRMKGKLVLKDVGRVHDVPWRKTEQITKMVPLKADGDEGAFECLKDTFKTFPETAWYKERWPDVVMHAQRLEGNVRHSGVHAAGFVISDEPLRNLVPVQYQKAGKGDYLVGWDKKQVEAVGLLKLDILGIDSLQYIQRCLDLVEERTGEKIEPEEWEDLNDELVLRNFAEGNTELVWQMNSLGAIRLLKKLRPDRFDHLVAATALIRPGPQNAGITDEYVKRRNGESTKSLHAKLDEILDETYGLMVFQEDVIRIVHDIGGFTWGEADRIRKDIGKKKGVEYLKKTYLDRFVSGAAEHGMSEAVAKKLWYQIAEFGQYGFNLSHSVGYTMLSYWTMYLKLYHPLEFMCAALETEDKTDKQKLYIREAKRLGIKVTVPDVNISGNGYVIDPNSKNTIRAGLVDVKGLGEKTVDKIVSAAPYDSFRDFVERSGANKTAIVALLRIGALDSLVDEPKHVEENIVEILKVRIRKKPHLKEKYWAKIEDEGLLEVDEGGEYTTKERDEYKLALLSLPPEVHPTNEALNWVTENCPHLTFQPINRFEELFPVDFSNNYYFFLGVITKVKYFQDAPSTDDSDDSENSFGNRVARVYLEDDTGALTCRLGPGQLRSLKASDLSVGQLLIVVAHNVGFYRLSAAGVIPLGRLVQAREERAAKDLGGLPGAMLLDPFAGYRQFLQGRGKLKTFKKGRSNFRVCVYVISAETKVTKKRQKMMTVCCQDLHGNIRDVLVWPSDYSRYAKKIQEHGLTLLHLKGRKEGGKERFYFLNTSTGKNPIMPFDKYYAANTDN